MNIVELSLESLEMRYARLRVRRPGVERQLMNSLDENGQQSPVVVVAGSEAGRYVVIDGHKRVQALRKLKSDIVKAVVWELEREGALVLAYQQCRGTGWNAVEEGWLVAELTCKWSIGEVGKRLNRSKSWVSRRLGLVESLPECVVKGVQEGRIGAYAAAKYLLPLARANGADCEKLGLKISGLGLSSREIGILYRHYAQGNRKACEKIIEEPVLFLKVAEAARQRDAAKVGSQEGRCMKNLELLGNIALGLTRSLTEAGGSDTTEGVRERLKPMWERVMGRVKLLERTGVAIFGENGSAEAPVVKEINYAG